jgi:hypothetical protein
MKPCTVPEEVITIAPTVTVVRTDAGTTIS